MTVLREERIGGQRLILGDCLEVMPTLGKVDAVVTDPPYGMDWDTDTTRFSGGNHKRGEGRADFSRIKGDSVAFDPAPFLRWPCVLWGSNHFASGLPVGRTLIWVKKPAHLWGTFLSDAEVAHLTGGHGVYCKMVSWNPPARAIDRGGDVRRPVSIHPTQKPVALMQWCLGFLPNAQTILDPFMGSGTTLVACQRMGRQGIGIEIDPEYFDIACRRVDEAARQPDLLIEAPAPAKQEAWEI